MEYLVDTSVLSEPTKPTPNARVIDWLRANERTLVIDPVIRGELRFGIHLLPRGKRRTRFPSAASRWKYPWRLDSFSIPPHVLAIR